MEWVYSFVVIAIADTFITSDGTGKGIASKLKQRMGKRQKTGSPSPKPKRSKYPSQESTTRQGKRHTKTSSSHKSGGGVVRFAGKTKGTAKTGGRVFRKKSSGRL